MQVELTWSRDVESRSIVFAINMHRLPRFFLFSALLFITAVSFAAIEDIGKTWPTASPSDLGFSDSAFEELDQFIRTKADTTGLLVIVDGKAIYQYGNTKQVSYIASCRKSILSILYGIYIERGKIDLSKTLAELGIDDKQGLSEQEKQATIYDIINSISGVFHPASNGGDDLKDAPERGSYKPGEYWLYSNWDFNVAGHIFEQETGVDIYDALEQELATPLGMRDFKRKTHKKGGDLSQSDFPSYHMHLSVRDMARVGQLMLQKGMWNGQRIVTEEWVRRTTSEIVTPRSEMNPPRMKNRPWAFSHMWWIWDRPEESENWQGMYSAQGYLGQFIFVVPKLNMVIAHKVVPKKADRNKQKIGRILADIIAAKE